MWRNTLVLMAFVGFPLFSLTFSISYADTINVYVSCREADSLNAVNQMSSDDTVQIYPIHCARLLDAQLNEKVKGHAKKDADMTAKHWMKSHFNQYLNALSQDNKALGKGVNKIPAIVINDRYVVYGTVDILKAKQLVNQFLADHQGIGNLENKEVKEAKEVRKAYGIREVQDV
jgi:integrating conjugative element protein (TIGR03757 family)